MDIHKLHKILQKTTVQLRKSNNPVKLPCDSVSIYTMPQESQTKGNIEMVDLHFIVVGVNKIKAEQYKDELVTILKTYPQPERLAGGPSYIEVGCEIGDQGAAFRLFALGKVLGFWDIITPAKLGITGPEADHLAGTGLVMISGFKVT